METRCSAARIGEKTAWTTAKDDYITTIVTSRYVRKSAIGSYYLLTQYVWYVIVFTQKHFIYFSSQHGIVRHVTVMQPTDGRHLGF